MKNKKKLLRWGFISYNLFLLLVNVLPGINSPHKKINYHDFKFEIRFDYIGHFTLFFIAGGFAILLFQQLLNNKKYFVLIGVLALQLLFSWGIESSQLFIDHRTYNPMDLLMNLSGNTLGFISGALFLWKRRS